MSTSCRLSHTECNSFHFLLACNNHLFPFNLQKEEALPSLPVPDLETTLQKYLAQVEAITPNHLEKTRSLVRAFLSGPGPKLQQRLLERRQKVTNWVSNILYLARTSKCHNRVFVKQVHFNMRNK